mmetsp:Transcript_9988/g.30498  ORF Transcript_9988/g.30498 Transcript_9988/m.30498 type:complete len:232 (-) Transcript_9988:404-1099(-)
MVRNVLICSVALLAVVLRGASGVQFYLPHGKRQCFTETLPTETKVVTEYMVAAGKGEMPIDFEVKDLHGKVVYSKSNVDHGKVAFTTPKSLEDNEDYYDYDAEPYENEISGTTKYELCFENKFSGSPDPDMRRRVAVKILKGQMARDYKKIAEDEHLSNLEISLEAMNDELKELLQELEDVRLREDSLRMLNERTNKRVVIYSAIACVVMMGVGGYQMFYMRNYFRKKKLI